MSEVKLTFNSNDYIVTCNSVKVGWKNNNVSKPNANGTEVVEVQTQSFENPTYVLEGVHLIEGTGNLTYDALLSMAKNKYDGTNGITLTINYSSATKNLVGSDGTTTAIPVVIDAFNAPISMGEYDDNGTRRYLIIGSITLKETA